MAKTEDLIINIVIPQDDDEFAAGDVVRLKSGGPKMTVLRAGDIGVTAGWFDGGSFRESRFGHSSLIHVEPRP